MTDQIRDADLAQTLIWFAIIVFVILLILASLTESESDAGVEG